MTIDNTVRVLMATTLLLCQCKADEFVKHTFFDGSGEIETLVHRSKDSQYGVRARTLTQNF